MGKRRLTKGQIKRQQITLAQRVKRSKLPIEWPQDELCRDLGPLQPGLLIAHYGTTLIVENQEGKLFNCSFRQNLDTLVTGDEIIWQQIDESSGVVVACQPRRSIITRPDRRHSKPIAANVDKMVIVVALEPLPHPTTLDRYLILAEVLGLEPLIVVNKMDLLAKIDAPFETQFADLAQKLALYQQLGYRWIKVCCKTAMGLSDLEQSLAQNTSILVGQSGVGKSSLLSRLVPDVTIQIGELSKTHRLGRHTTTASRLYHLPQSGHLIDSPGIHQFNLHHFTQTAITNAFKEFLPFLGKCKFRNCEHVHEPGCALLQAVTQGDIAPFRLQNFHTILADL